jgi:asparagine synthase (glutamine-hydrolysing)
MVRMPQGPPIQAGTAESVLSALSLHSHWVRLSSGDAEAFLGATASATTISLHESADVVAVCEGGLTNRAELAAMAGIPAANADAAAILAALYRKHGADIAGRLRGDLAFALWDRSVRRLLLAVDRFAIRPLCYAARGDSLVFASQPRGLFAAGVEKRVHSQAIVNYLNFSAVPIPQSAFEGVLRVRPGELVAWSAGRVQTSQYWEINYAEDEGASLGRMEEALLAGMDEAVRSCSAGVPDAQLGCFLSGGTDSSSVLGLLTRQRNSAVNSFSIGFGEQPFNELAYAHVARDHFRSNHAEAILKAEDAFAAIPKVIAAYDEPFGNASAIPTFHCEQLARERGVTTLLAGDGGDELFGGNERYRTHEVFEIYRKCPAVLRKGLIEPLLFGLPVPLPLWNKARRYVRASNQPNPDRYFRWYLLQHFPPEKILAPGMPFGNGHGDLLAVPREYYRAAPAQSELNRLLYIDLKMTLGDNDLPKVVRMAEVAGVTVRFPYLDHRLAEFSATIPARWKVKGLEKRYLFKRATRGLLPRAILEKKKHGFGLPISVWLKSHPQMRKFAEEVMLDARTYQRGYFRREFIESLFTGMDSDPSPFHGDLLWLFLMLELWHRHHVEGRAA